MLALAKDLISHIQEHDVLGSAAELAFRFLFALFPFFIVIAALSSFVSRWLAIDNPAQRLVTQLADVIPEDAASVLERNLESIFEGNHTGLLSFGAVLALWAASGGVKTLVKNINHAYGVRDDRPFLWRQALGLLLTVLMGIGFLVGAIVLIVGQVVGYELATALGMGDAGATAVTYARIPAVVLMIMVTVGLLYWVAPNISVRLWEVSVGALLFVILWILATLGFGVYVANFGAYDATYGTLGGLIVLMMWLYITSLALLLGAEVNALTHERRHGPADTGRESDPVAAPDDRKALTGDHP